MVQDHVRVSQTGLQSGKEQPRFKDVKGDGTERRNIRRGSKRERAKSGNTGIGHAGGGHAAGRRQRDGETVRRRVAACVLDDFAVTAAELGFGSRGSPQAALARQVAMYLCHTGFALSFEMIGRLFGRDRTTVAHACRVIEERREDVWFDCRIATLERACGLAPMQEDRR